MENLEALLKRHPFFEGLPADQVAFLAGCGRNVSFRAGQMIFREGEPADQFFVVREGLVRIEMSAPRTGPVAVQTVHPGQVLGWSWLFPPYRWHFDAHAIEPTRATALDGKCLREKLDRDPALGYAVVKRFAGILLDRLQATRAQILQTTEEEAASRR